MRPHCEPSASARCALWLEALLGFRGEKFQFTICYLQFAVPARFKIPSSIRNPSQVQDSVCQDWLFALD